jgi:hypothetical protein
MPDGGRTDGACSLGLLGHTTTVGKEYLPSGSDLFWAFLARLAAKKAFLAAFWQNKS